MKSLILPGRILFAAGLAALGVLNFIHGDFVQGLEPAPSWIPARPVWPYASGAILIAASACLLIDATRRKAAMALQGLFLVWLVLFHTPTIAAADEIGIVTPTFETLALSGAAWLLAGALPNGQEDGAFSMAGKVGRLCFAASLFVFGAMHFVYADFVANMIPAWIPGREFFAYFTGAAHIAAGAGIVAGVLSRLAAILLAAMFASFVLLVHVPRMLADIANRQEWTSLFVATALTGAALIVAASFAKQAADVEGVTKPATSAA